MTSKNTPLDFKHICNQFIAIRLFNNHRFFPLLMENLPRSIRYILPARAAVQLVVTALWLLTGHVIWADRLPERPMAAAPMAIGNTVFHDYNRNGNQDSGEPGIANIPLRLFQNGTEQGRH